MSRMTHVPVDEDALPERPASPDAEREARIAVLERYMTAHRRWRLERALSLRTGHVQMVVDGVYDLGNVSAIMRTCDGLGVHHVHIVENVERYKPAHRTSQGSHKWLSLHMYQDPVACIDALHAQGIAVYGAALEGEHDLETLDVSRPFALAMGSEAEGLSKEMLDGCDALYRIDMRGLAQSYNVAVAGALSLYSVLSRRARELGCDSAIPPGDLPDDITDTLREQWYRKAVKNSDVILERELGVAPPPLPRIEGPIGELE